MMVGLYACVYGTGIASKSFRTSHHSRAMIRKRRSWSSKRSSAPSALRKRNSTGERVPLACFARYLTIKRSPILLDHVWRNNDHLPSVLSHGGE